jgi:hypothetical protein
LAIDTREEDRLEALGNIEKYQDETRKWRNKKVREQKISMGDMVLQRKMRGIEKLEETRQGAYRLQTLEGEGFLTHGISTSCRSIGSKNKFIIY